VKSQFFVCFYNSSDDPRLHLYDHKVMSFTIPIAAFTPSNKNALSYFAFLQFIWRSSLRQAADFELIDGLIVRGKKKEEEIELLENLQKSKLKTSLSEMELFVKNERNSKALKSYEIEGCYKWDLSHLNLAPFFK